MIALMVLSLAVIGIVTVFFFKQQNEAYHQERLARKERAIKTEMNYFSREVEIQQGLDVVIKEFEEQVVRLSKVHNLEINVYNTQGEMLVAARPTGLHAEYVNRGVPRNALDSLQNHDRIVLEERRDGHHYLSDYTLLKNAEGERIAILHIPYRQDLDLRQNDLPEFLGSLGISYLILFLSAISLTVLLSNNITKNISVLGNKLENIDLNALNERIEWSANDEVGRLIAAYNEMFLKLKESRDLLAKTEREGAWREMAKQVAHEIKNPLTPIKLSIQHLVATASYDDHGWQEKFQTTMKMIIGQIETLDRIAKEFSDFAKMPKLQHEATDLRLAVREVKTLFANAPFTFHASIPEQPVMVNIDPDAISRVLNNLVKNAKQAVISSEDPQVSITLTAQDNLACISVEDNGVGIPEEQQSKIFEPNFTTKSGGTGLGLAMCKQLLENSGGTIEFESQPNDGTCFTITLPLIHS